MPWCKIHSRLSETKDEELRTADFHYELPAELIAQYPAEKRDASRLIVLHRATGLIEHRRFSDLPGYLSQGDILVLNDTRVFPARLTGKLSSGNDFEVLLLRALENGCWLALVRPARRLKPGRSLEVGNGNLKVTVKNFGGAPGERIVSLETQDGGEVAGLIERYGHVPLPPYINRPDTESDRERYQTVYARAVGAVAAPTAGLHFTCQLLKDIKEAGTDLAEITLHVGPGTFRPVVAEKLADHKMEAEYFEIEHRALERIKAAREAGGRAILVGTTTVRALESVASISSAAESGSGEKLSGWTELFIRPGFEFTLADALVTNFHLPRSTLLMLVCAFAGKELIEAAYREAIDRKYRFYSYGDAMLIL